jgi:hypothetical protein
VKRTNYRANPEDAAWFTQFRDRTRQMVGAGMAADAAVEKLKTLGVPEETAKRIVRAAEQELAVGKEEPVHVWHPIWWIVGFGLPMLVVCVVYSRFMEGATDLDPRTVVKVAALVVVAGLGVIALFRGRSKTPSK